MQLFNLLKSVEKARKKTIMKLWEIDKLYIDAYRFISPSY